MVTIPWPLPLAPLPVIMQCPGYRIQRAVRKLQTGHILWCQWWDLHISRMVLPVMKPTLQKDDGAHCPSHDHYQWWNLCISEIVLPVMRPTMQDDDGDFPLTRQGMISQPRSQNHTFWLKWGLKHNYMPGKYVQSILKCLKCIIPYVFACPCWLTII